MSDGPAVAAPSTAAVELGSIDLLEGIPEVELAELRWALRRREVPVGEVLWRQGDGAEGLGLVVDGSVSLSMALPGGGELEVATARAGDMVGEVAAIDGGPHSMTARASEPTRLLMLGRVDFTALIARRHPTALLLKRRMAAAACGRIRRHLRLLADSLGGEGPAFAGEAPEPFTDLELRKPPDSRYVRRLANFRAFDSLALWGMLTAGRYAFCPAGSTMIAEGVHSPACGLIMNGAVEKVIARGSRRIRVGLAGPGQAFGYESLIDGAPSAFTAITRERTLLLLLPRTAFDRLFGGDTAGSNVFLDVILRDLMAALRQAMRPHARLAVSV
jgi:CRP-like cAMP-binding protein